jgi:hypothetical protein
MNDWRKLLLSFTIIFLVGIFGFTFIKQFFKPVAKKSSLANSSPAMSSQPQFTPSPDPYVGWTVFRNGYALPVPPKWKNTSDLNGTAVLEPGEKLAGIIKISVTILSDKKATAGQRFTTQKEFDQWYAVSTQVQGNIQKLKNVNLDVEKAVVLFDTTQGTNHWQTIIWSRKEERNIYLTFTGTDEYGVDDATAIDYITSHFTFTPPAMTEKEGKE